MTSYLWGVCSRLWVHRDLRKLRAYVGPEGESRESPPYAAAITEAAKSLEAAGAKVSWDTHPDIDVETHHSNYLYLLSGVMGAGMPEEVFEGAKAAVEAADPGDNSLVMQQMRGIAQSHRKWLGQNEERQLCLPLWPHQAGDRRD
jgi:amidase